MKNTCYYLYWFLLNLNQSTEITLNSNKRVRSINNRSKHFSCSSIKINNKVIFEAESEYIIQKDPIKHFLTIKFDDDTRIPLMESSAKRKYSADESCRIQQHILVTSINYLLKPYNVEIPSFVKRASTNLVSFLTFSHYFDIDDYGNLFMIEFSKLHFNTLCESLKSVFSFFLDKQTGLTKQLVISGEETKETTGIIQTHERIIISRELFIQIVWYIRKTGCSVSDLLVIEPFTQTETKENDEK